MENDEDVKNLPAKIEDQDEKDYEAVRQNIYRVIETGANALDELAQVAAQSQHPRAYEVLANLVKTMVDANKDLIQLKKTKAEVEKINNKTTSSGQTNIKNSIFVGSTAELQKMLNNAGNPQIIDITNKNE